MTAITRAAALCLFLAAAPAWAAAPGAGAAPSAPRLSQAELAGYVSALNDGEVRLGQAGSARAENPQVKDFAARLQTDHAQSNLDLRALTGKLGINAQDSDLTEELNGQILRDLDRLAGLSADSFDRQFLAEQVVLHREAINELDELIPEATDPQFAGFLRQTRSMLSAHLNAAESLEPAVPGRP